MALATYVIPAGRGVVGQTLGFHAYSLRVDNLSGQWLQEQSTLSWIPPYSLGNICRLYGTGVALILNEAPWGQPQPGPILGEYAVAVFSDELRTETAGTPVREYSLTQAVSDLSQGSQPAWPAAGVDRLYADTSGNIHHLHSNGTDLTLVDPSNAAALLFPTFDPHYQAIVNASALGGDLWGTVANGHVNAQSNPVNLARTLNVQWGSATTNTNVDRIVIWSDANMYLDLATGIFNFRQGGTTLFTVNNGNVQVIGGGGTATLQSNSLQFWDAVIQRWNANQIRFPSSGGITVLGDMHAENTASISGQLTLSSSMTLPRGQQILWGDSNTKIWNDNGINCFIDYWSTVTMRSMSQSAGNRFQLDASGNLTFYAQVTHSGGQYLIDTGNVGYGYCLRDTNVMIRRPVSANYMELRSYDQRYEFCDASGNSYYSVRNSGQTDHYGVNGSANQRFFHLDTSWMGTQAANFQVQSDIRYKSNVIEVSDADCLTRLRTPDIPVITWTPDNPMPDSPSLRDIGFSAQAMQHATPETVTVDTEGNYFLAYGNLTAVLWGALRNVDARLQALEAHVHATQPGPPGTNTGGPIYPSTGVQPA